MTTMTYEEWQQKKATDKAVKEHLEEQRHRQFEEEQQRESVFTRQTESIVDVDSV
jgi:hypothetical protein